MKRSRFLSLLKIPSDMYVSLARRDCAPILDPAKVGGESYSIPEALLMLMALRLGDSPDGGDIARGRAAIITKTVADDVLAKFGDILRSGETFRRDPTGPAYLAGTVKTAGRRIPFLGTGDELAALLAAEGHEVLEVILTNLSASAAVLLHRAVDEKVDVEGYFGEDAA